MPTGMVSRDGSAEGRHKPQKVDFPLEGREVGHGCHQAKATVLIR
jgi:hypothetical protein